MDVIYTYGGGHALYKVFNGIAAFTANGSLYWKAFLVPAAIIGGVWGAAMATAKGDLGLFAKKSFVPAYLLLSLFIIPKTSVLIKDQVDPSFGFDRVDNVPAGLVMLTAPCSSLATYLAELMEEVFGGGGSSNFTQTGLSFASRLTQEARTLRIADVDMRENVKDFCNQCVWLPYIVTNIQGKREDARKTKDLVTWVEANGHPSLGIYWRLPTGGKEFKICSEAAREIRNAIGIENDKGLSSLFTRLFGFKTTQESSARLAPFVQDAWNTIAKSTQTAAQHIQQILVVNAYKEAFDDGREKAGYNRLHPELVSLSAARALEAQGMTGLIKGAAASISLPLLQSYLVGFLCITFFLVIPFCFMPGGLSILGLWAKMMFSVQMWPVFSCILNVLSQMWMDNSANTVLQGAEGFSIATTTGLADAAFSVACWSAGMQMLVPVIAWGFISKSGYAITGIFQAATSTVESNASRMASDAVDGNVSLNNFSAMNENLGNKSFYNQNHHGRYDLSSSVDDGHLKTTYDPSGKELVEERDHALKNNYSMNKESSMANLAEILESRQIVRESIRAYNDNLLKTGEVYRAHVDNMSKGVNTQDGYSIKDDVSRQKLGEDLQSGLKALHETTGIDEQTVFEATLGAMVSAEGRVGGGGAGGSVGGKLDLSGQYRLSANERKALEKALNTDEGQRYVENFSKMYQHSRDQNAQNHDSAGGQYDKGLRSAVSNLKSSEMSLREAESHSRNIQNAMSESNNARFGVSSNKNSEWLEYVKKEKGFSSLKDAVNWTQDNQNQAEVQKLSGSFENSHKRDMRIYAYNSPVSLGNTINPMGGESPSFDSIPTVPPHGSFLTPGERNSLENIDNSLNQKKVDFKTENQLREKYNNLQGKYNAESSKVEGDLNETREKINQEKVRQEAELTEEQEKTNAERVASLAVKNVKEFFGIDSETPSDLNSNLPSGRKR